MVIVSLFGIAAGLLLFIVLCFRRTNTILAAVLSAMIMIALSLPAMGNRLSDMYGLLISGRDGFISYMSGVGGFIKSYLLLFMFSALYGKVMDDSGAIRRIALALKRVIRRSKHAKFYAVCVLPVFYIVLGYCGISGFVMVFAVVALGRELFSECDVPWRFYCYGALGNITNGVLAGNLQAQNLKAAELFGVSPTAGAAMSLVFCAVQLTVAALIIWFDVRKCEKRGEGFYPDGEAIMRTQIGESRAENELPGLLKSVLPIALTVFVVIALKAEAETTLAGVSILCFLILHRQLVSPKDTLNAGLQAGIMPVVTVAAVTGLATIMPQMPGFAVIATMFDKLSDLTGGVLLISVMTALIANTVPVLSSEGIATIIAQKFAGISAENGARLAICAQLSPCTPWCAGVINAVALTKIDLKTASWYYFGISFFPSLAALAVVMQLIALGVFA